VIGDACHIHHRFDGPEDAPVVMLSHSLGANMAMWDPQMEALTLRYRVLRYDLRGHGRSNVPAGAYSLDRLGRDVIELMDGLGIGRVHYCGLSLGGMIGQWLGVRAADRLCSLTLANTSAYMGPPSGWDDRIVAVRASGMAAMRDAVLARWFTPDFSDTAAIGDMIETTDPQGYAGCCAAIRDMDLRRLGSLITTPTLIIGGLQDPATPPNHAEALHAQIRGSQLVLLNGAHLSNIECTAEFNSTLLTFLQAQGRDL
jgi:3-oxoadipate enol-lactonase